MTTSYTFSDTATFTVTHARHIAAKVATDLKRLQRFYGLPSDQSIEKYEREVIGLLKAGYLGTVTYGFKRNGNYIEPTLRYRAQDLSLDFANDDDPGKIRPGADISGANFSSFLTYSSEWWKLSSAEQKKFEESLPFQRSEGQEPGLNGFLENDKTYSSGGKSLTRASLRSY